ncbi:hypothetical protein [Streptomyces sp. NPDC016172]|uniref:hypothetical protein n=1 Tax=Streptomyces sp. NPDC016172 TaxID=3364964 RepID=UPI0036F767B2
MAPLWSDSALACADGRWTRRLSGHRSITNEVREAICAVKAECGERARLSLSAKHRLMHQYMRERFPAFPTRKIPSRGTLATVWKEWFGSDGAQPRYARTAQAAAEAGVSGRMVVHRPGQVLVLVLDSTPMPVKLREAVFGEAVTATLPLALDLYTHGLPAFRLTLQSDTSVDIAMLLRDVMLPLPMRDDWGKPPHRTSRMSQLRLRCPRPGPSTPARSTTRSMTTAVGDAKRLSPASSPWPQRRCTRP